MVGGTETPGSEKVEKVELLTEGLSFISSDELGTPGTASGIRPPPSSATPSIAPIKSDGAKTPPDIIRAVHRKIGKVYIGAFGMSEGTGCTTRLDDDEEIILGQQNIISQIIKAIRNNQEVKINTDEGLIILIEKPIEE